MKILINYDFVEALRDVNEPFGPMKIMRNDIYKHLKIDYPFWLLLDTIYLTSSQSQDIKVIPGMIATQIILCESLHIALPYASYKKDKKDIYKIESEERLKKLVRSFNDNYISTDYDLLLKSEYYEHITKLEINENKLPFINSKKYILVPTYTCSGIIEETSIEQEHILGTKEYSLSIGTPSKVRKLVLSRS